MNYRRPANKVPFKRRDIEASPPKDKANPYKILFYLNVAALVVHAIAFVGLLTVAIVVNVQFRATLTSSFSLYDQLFHQYQVTLKTLANYSLIWVLIPFPAITAAFHAIYVFFPEYYNSLVEKGGNYLRWIEYSLSASLMTWCLMQMSGVTDIFVMILVGLVLNIALQFTGYLFDRTKDWTVLVLGWLLFLVQWVFILAYFFYAVANGSKQVPVFVYVSVLSLFFAYAGFGLVPVLYLRKFFIKTPVQYEEAYIILSLVSKVILEVSVFAGILKIQ